MCATISPNPLTATPTFPQPRFTYAGQRCRHPPTHPQGHPGRAVGAGQRRRHQQPRAATGEMRTCKYSDSNAFTCYTCAPSPLTMPPCAIPAPSQSPSLPHPPPQSIPADDSPTPTRATPRSSTPRVALTKTPPPALSPVSPTSRRDPRPRSPLARNSATQGASNRSPFAEDGTPAMELGGSQSHSQSHSPSLSPTSAGGHEGQGIAGDGEGARDAWGGEGKGNGGGAEGVGSARRRVAEWRPAQGNAAGDLAELERCPLAQVRALDMWWVGMGYRGGASGHVGGWVFAIAAMVMQCSSRACRLPVMSTSYIH